MSEIRSNIEVEIGSERSFGVVFGIVFILIGLYPLFVGGSMRVWAVILASLFFTLAFLAPKLLSGPNRLWFKLGMALGAIIAPIVMVIVYFSTVVPVGLIMRLTGKDLLRQKIDKGAKSYWIKREQAIGSMRNQF